MAMQKHIRRRIGQILLDGGFLSRSDLELALEEQKNTNELLGEVLIKMGLIDPMDIKAALAVQAYLHLGRLEDAVRAAAGVRRKLGELLVRSGRIAENHLEQALAEQKRTGEKLGEILMRLGLLTEEQLNGLLAFQRVQGEGAPSSSPLRLGELLVSTGCVTRPQLDEALGKQALSRKQLGAVLVEEGYAEPRHIKHGMRLQEMLLAAVLAAFLAACGGGPADTSAVTNQAETSQLATNQTTTSQIASNQTETAPEETLPAYSPNYFKITSSDFDILTPNYYFSADSVSYWSVQAAVAQDYWDPAYKCIIRIDIEKPGYNEMPAINKAFSLGENTLYDKFPGAFLVFNGELKVSKKVEEGVLIFTPDSKASGLVQATYDVIVSDIDPTSAPAPRYHITGSLNFTMGTYGPAAL